MGPTDTQNKAQRETYRYRKRQKLKIIRTYNREKQTLPTLTHSVSWPVLRKERERGRFREIQQRKGDVHEGRYLIKRTMGGGPPACLGR